MQVTDRTVGANPTGFDMRTELNNIIAALESDNSGSSEPLNTVAYMKWLDTSNATYYYYKERNHDNTAWVTLFRYTVATKIMEAVSNGVVLSKTNIASEIHASSSKTTPVDADEIGLIDSASTFTLKKLTWANLKATLKTYFDTLYMGLTGDQTIAGIKTFSSSPIVPTPATSTQVASKGYVDGLNIAWVANDSRAMTSLNASGTAPIYACRAWVNFNGTGTVAIRAGGNVSSITDNGVGLYECNFLTAMPDLNYSVSKNSNTNGATPATPCAIEVYSLSSSKFNIATGSSSVFAAYADHSLIALSVFR